MPRPGRKRKLGPREQNGRLRRMLDAERDRNVVIAEKLVVLSQPHRNGDTDQKLESPLGRLIRRHKLREELYDAGLEYGGLVRQFYAAKGIPPPSSDGSGSGSGVSPEKAIWLHEELDRLERPLKRLSIFGFGAMRTLAVHEMEISFAVEPHAIMTLHSLAKMLKKLGS